jgi:hypothetical protein
MTAADFGDRFADVSTFIVMTPNGNEMYPLEIRYAWPSELDAMARSAGMKLENRWSDWRGAPFTARSPQHVSLYIVDV